MHATSLPLLIVATSGGEIALPLTEVHRVVELRPEELTPVPRAPALVLGLYNHWGRLVTVIDLGATLRGSAAAEAPARPDPLSAPASASARPLLILERAGRQVGLLAQTVLETASGAKYKPLETRPPGLITHEIELERMTVGVLGIDQLMQILLERCAQAARP